MIEVSGLYKRFGQVEALRDVSFTVDKGKIVGFLGANGAGKTTTMDIICGCSGADAGTAKVSGYDVTEQAIEAKKRLGYLPDIPPLHPEMRVIDYVSYAAKLHRVPSAKLKQRVAETLERLSLQDVRHRLVGNLSKGFRQRVALAQALVHEPEVLVLDEPTEGLDPTQIIQIRELIRSLAGHHTIILSSHILSEVQNTCDEIIIIHQGQVVQKGRYADIVSQMQAGRVYRLRVGREAAAFVDELAARDFVVKPKLMSSADQEVEFGLAASSSEEMLDQLVKLAIDRGHGLRELAPKTKSLEEVFLQLTQKDTLN